MWSFYYLFERKWHEKFQIRKILNFIHVHFETTMQIFLIMAYRRELMGAKWLHSGRNKWNSVNHLWFHEKWCATKLFCSYFWNVWLYNFDNLKFQDASKVTIFRPPNSYILHCHGKCGLFNLYLRGNGMKNSKFGKSCILYTYTLGPQCKIFNYGFQEQLMGDKWICILIGINETQGTTFDFMRYDVLQNYLIHIFEMFGW